MTSEKKWKYIYGPVYSWRLGVSLGIDPLSQDKKICNFDCVYCQLGKTDIKRQERRVYVPVASVISEIKKLPPIKLDYLTFSARGEPTLAKNLGAMIKALRKLRKEKIAVITNSVLMTRPDVRADLALADFVLAKLDCYDQASLKKINRPAANISFAKIVEGIKKFRREYQGKLALQMMFIDANKKHARALAALTRAIAPDEVEINTPLRPSDARPLLPEELNKIKKYFAKQPVKTVYELKRRTFQPLNKEQTIKRHGQIKVTDTFN